MREGGPLPYDELISFTQTPPINQNFHLGVWAFGYFTKPSIIILRYAFGVHFLYFLKVLLKYCIEVKPESNAISEMLLSVEESSLST